MMPPMIPELTRRPTEKADFMISRMVPMRSNERMTFEPSCALNKSSMAYK